MPKGQIIPVEVTKGLCNTKMAGLQFLGQIPRLKENTKMSLL